MRVLMKRRYAPKRKVAKRTYGPKFRLPGRISAIQAEPKQVDININSGISNVAAVFLVNGVSQGSSEYQRIGRRIQMKSFELNGCVLPQGVAGYADYFRIALVYDRQSNAAAPAYSDIWQEINNAGTTNSSCYSHRNVDNGYRFLVLKEQDMSSPPGGASQATAFTGTMADTMNAMKLNWRVNLSGLPVHYIGDGATVASISTGSLFLIWIGNQNASSIAALNGSSRVTYLDA